MGFLTLMAKLGLDGSSFAAGLNGAQAQAKNAGARINNSLGSSIKGQLAGAFGVAAITALAAKTVEYGSKINDLSLRVGISSEKLQEFGYAAEQTGSSLDAVVSGFEKMATSRESALRGNEEMVASFQALGVTVADLKNKTAAQRFEAIAADIKRLGLNEQRVVALRAVLGRSAGELIPAMREGLDGLAAQAHATGQVIKDETITALDELGDKAQAFGKSLMGGIAPVLLWLLNRLNQIKSLFTIGKALLIDSPMAMLGAVSGGATKKEAWKAGDDIVNAALDKAKALEEKKPAREPAPPEEEERKEKQKRAPAKTPAKTIAEKQTNADQLARIGGFTGPSAAMVRAANMLPQILRELQASRRVQQQAADSMKSIGG